MARAKAGTWFNLVAGLVVGAAAPPLFLGAARPESPPDAPDAATPARGDAALDAAADALRQGDYDEADRLLRRAVPADARDRRELARLQEALTVAVEARRAGAEQVRLAEQAAAQGNEARVADLLRRLAPNEPYLTAADRRRLARLTPVARGQAPHAPEHPDGPPSAATPGSALANAKARAALKSARAQMAQFNFERAEQLAREAERLQPKLAPGEDSPKRVLDDLARVRTDPKALLTAARVALGRKDYARAEEFAKLSEKNAGAFTFPFWADSPSKVLKDVQQLRGRAPAAAAAKEPAAKPAPAKDPGVVPASATSKAKPAGEPATKPAVPPGSREATEQAAGLIKQARQALAAGELARARKLNDQARALKPDLHWWEDNPEKVQGDIVRAELKAKPAAAKADAAPAGKPAAGKPTVPVRPQTKEEAVALVKKGRELLAENKVDEATQACLKARSASVSWGLFEDTPEKLRQDVDKARARRDREESVKVLAEARRLYEEGKYDEASKAAFRAQKLHGAYSIWELGDRPERVLADVDSAKIRKAKGQPVEVVKKDAAKKPADVAKKDADKKSAADVAQAPARGGDRAAQARQTLAEARAALQAGDADRAKALAEQAKAMRVAWTAPGEDTPEAVLGDVRRAADGRGAAAARAPAAAEDDKGRAVRLLAEARALQKSQKLVEARDRVAEARQVRVVYGPGEETPDTVQQQLLAEARWQLDWLVRDAVRLTGSTGPDMARRYARAEQELGQARTLAAGFGLDAGPVDAELVRVRGGLAAARGETPAPAPAVAAAPKNHGAELLEKARLEIQRGETVTARKLAEEAAQGPYGVRDEALAVIRSVDAEEFNQRRLQSNRTFDAALAAYNRRDYANAGNLMQTVDPANLDEARRNRFREIAMTPEMRPAGRPTVVQVQATGTPGLPAVPQPAVGEQPGFARADDHAPGDALLGQTEAMRQVKFQQLRQQGLEVQRDASEKFRTGQTDAAVDLLQDYLAQLNDVQLDQHQVALLRRPVDSRLQQFKLLKAQRDFLTEEKGLVQGKKDAKTREVLFEQSKQKKVADLMKQYNTFYKEGKYAEAERLAVQAHELDPDNPLATAAVSVARTQYRLATVKKDTANKEEMGFNALRETDDFGPAGVVEKGLVIDADKAAETRSRGGKYLSISASPKTEKDREVERRLAAPVTLNFADTPLKNVIDDLRAWQGINIYVDTTALEEEGISLEKPVTVKLEQVAMKSALNLMLPTAHLTWAVKDGVLQITTPKHAKGGLRSCTYPVADLVIPVPDFATMGTPYVPQLPHTDAGRPGYGPPTPYAGLNTLGPGTPVGANNGSGSGGGTSPFGSDAAPQQSPQVTREQTRGTIEEKLMNLITHTVAPNSWSDSGGPGTIDYFPLNMALVINQTPDIQEQVAELLASLRRLQDLEVAVEVRLISIDETFFERIGVDFNMSLQTKNSHIEPQLLNGIFQPDGQINVLRTKNTIVGLQPTGQSFTPDLNIPITTQTYTQTFPQFGGYNGIPGFGGITMGLAFLSDIQLFLFLEAVQGDTRTNIMQAPKLTLFNGQASTIAVTTFQNFVTNVTVGNSQGIFTFTPTVTMVPVGVTLAMNAVITGDRRFVRMSIAPNLTNNASSVVPLFPIVVPLYTQIDGSQINSGGGPVVFTQYIQMPSFTNVTVATTVTVPDGGTVLMGGLKLLSEERQEYGPPILSKIPIISRLFKNTSYGRDAQSLLIMVTPRIIIQEEEETRQTGYTPPPPPTF